MRAQWEDPGYGGGGGGMQFAFPRLTPVVKVLLIANVAVFLLQDIFLPAAAQTGFLHVLALYPQLWIDWFPLLPIWQVVSYGFLHGGVGHLLQNMLFLYFLGTMLEELVGTRRLLAFYGAALAVAGFAQLMLGLALGETSVILGASGGVLAIAAAVATLRPQTRIIFIIVPMTLKTLVLLLVALDVYTLVKDLQGVRSGVASFAHLSGAALGFFAVRRGWIWMDPLERLGAWKAGVDRQRAEEEQERLDALLAKINREGIQSLSGRERAFLKRVSKRR